MDSIQSWSQFELFITFKAFAFTNTRYFASLTTSLEDALLTPPGQTNNLLQEILTRFILILRPQSRNIGYLFLQTTLLCVAYGMRPIQPKTTYEHLVKSPLRLFSDSRTWCVLGP